MNRTFDWKPRFDKRSLNFTIVDTFGISTPLKTRRRNQWGIYLDQDMEGACVGFGTAKALLQTPKRRKNITNQIARDIYHRAKDLDEWPGTDYDGTSVLAAMKTMHEAGWISAYYWATSLKQMQHAVSSDLGPIVFGCLWYEGMWDVDSKGYIKPEGYILGGHCVCLGGIDMKRGAFIVNNSWGPTWGGNGAPVSSAFLSFEHADLLLHQQGEAALMRKI